MIRARKKAEEKKRKRARGRWGTGALAKNKKMSGRHRARAPFVISSGEQPWVEKEGEGREQAKFTRRPGAGSRTRAHAERTNFARRE